MSTIGSDYTRESLFGMYASNLTSQFQRTSLSDEQKSGMEELLSNYDVSDLSSDDALEIVSALKELGVNPSQETDAYLEELGVDAAELGQLMQASSNNNTLSDDQKSEMEEILSEFNSSSLTASDATSIVEAFSELGVVPSEELTSFLDELGFDAREIGDLARENSASNTAMQGSMPPPPPPPGVQDELSATLSELYEDSEDDESSFTTNPYASSNTSTSFSNLLDYTSRILSLNENSQQEVLDMFEEYNNSDNKSSLASSVRDSLSTILANQNNYASLSLYA